MRYDPTEHTRRLFDGLIGTAPTRPMNARNVRNVPWLDLFTLGLQTWPTSANPPELGEAWCHQVLSEMEKMPEVKALHQRIGNDPWCAVTAANHWFGALYRSAPKSDARVQTESELVDEIDGLRDMGTAGAKFTKRVASLEQDLADLPKEAAKWEAQVTAAMPDIRNAIREACQKAREHMDRVDEANDLMGSGWGQSGTRAPAATVADVQAREAAAKRMLTNDRVRQVLELAGKMLRVAERAQARKPTQMPSRIVGIEKGAEPERIVPEEYGALVAGDDDNPDDPGHALADLFWVKFIEKSLIQHRMVGTERRAKGPVVAAFDMSGSMNGLPEVWCKAVGLVLSRLAVTQGRRFLACEFDTSVTPVISLDPNTPPAEREKKILNWVQTANVGGGTEFTRPLTWCLDQIEAAPVFKYADVVFVTDGACGYSEVWLKQFQARKRKMETRVVGVGINCGYSLNVMEPLCDDLANIENLSADAAEVVFGV